MPFHVRAAGGAAWRSALSDQAGDVSRILEQDGATVAVLANGYDYAFSTCWPEGSRRVLDLFCAAWSSAAGPLPERLLAAFERTRELFPIEAPALLPQAAEDDHPPAATLLAVATDGTKAHAAWIGGDIAIHARSFGIADETTPHTLPKQYEKEHPEFVSAAKNLPNALVRTIGSVSDGAPPEIVTFGLQAADSIILLSKASLAGLGVSPDEAAFAAAAYASPSALADRLTQLGLEAGDSPYAAAIVFRFDAVDLASAIDQLITTYEPDPRHGAWLREWSTQHRALPVYFDMGGACGMRRDGSIISVAWEDRKTREEVSPVAHAAALIGAARNYKALAGVRPQRPPNAEPCTNCSPTPGPDGAPEGCPLCWYLGWRPPPPPKWFFTDFSPVPVPPERSH